MMENKKIIIFMLIFMAIIMLFGTLPFGAFNSPIQVLAESTSAKAMVVIEA